MKHNIYYEEAAKKEIDEYGFLIHTINNYGDYKKDIIANIHTHGLIKSCSEFELLTIVTKFSCVTVDESYDVINKLGQKIRDGEVRLSDKKTYMINGILWGTVLTIDQEYLFGSYYKNYIMTPVYVLLPCYKGECDPNQLNDLEKKALEKNYNEILNNYMILTNDALFNPSKYLKMEGIIY